VTRKILTLLFDAYLIIGSYILITGGTFLLPPELLVLFRGHPQYHRLILSCFSLAFIIFFFLAQSRGPIKKYSKIIAFIDHLNIKSVHWLWFIFFVISAIYSYSAVVRHHVFGSSFDFAVFAQAIRSVLNGKFLYSSIKGGICLLGDHMGPIILFFAPLYLLWDNPSILLIIQAIIALSAVFPLYLIAKLLLKSDRLGLIFALCYALYLPVRNASRFDFHPEILALPLCLSAYYFVVSKHLFWASVSLFVTLFSKETACAPIAMFGLYCWWFLKKPFFGISWFLISVTIFFLDVRVIVPYFSGGDYAYLSSNYMEWQNRGLIAFLSHFFQPASFTYLKKVFLPLGFFSLLSPSTLILTFPAIFQNLAARNELTRSIFFQYTVFLTPYVFISAIHGFKHFVDWTSKWWSIEIVQRFAIYWLIGWSLLLAGVSEIHIIQEYRRKDNPHYEYIRQYLKTVPKHISVRTHEFFAPHIPKVTELHIYENKHPREGGSEKAQAAEYVFIDKGFVDPPIESHVTSLKEKGYKIIHEHEGFYVFRKERL